jgi:hypothetical protein
VKLSRRVFFGLAAGAAAGMALDPEQLLWVPGAKTIFLPTPKQEIRSAVSLQRGDIFTIEGVFSVNPATYRHTGMLQQFVIVSDIKPGRIDIAQMRPKPIEHGEYMNVSGFSSQRQLSVRPLFTGDWIAG